MKLLLLFVLFFSTNLLANDSCARLHVMFSWYLPKANFEESVYHKLYGKLPQEWFEYLSVLDSKLNELYPEYGNDSHFLSYSYVDEGAKEEVSMQWAEDVSKVAQSKPPIGSKTSPINMEKLSGDVFLFAQGAKQFVARNVDARSDIYAMTQGRAVMAASKVEAHFGFDIYPDYTPQIINGKTYVVTPFARGETVGPKRGANAASTYLKALEDGSLKQESYWLAQGFSFLLGDKDSDPTNTLKRPDGSVLLVDPGQALYFGADAAASDLSYNVFDHTPFGLTVPYKYSRKFISKLKEMDHDSWEDLLIDEALGEEIQLIMYRQRLMLLDAATRGESAFFD